MKSRNISTLIIGIGFLIVLIIGFMFYGQFRDLTQEYNTSAKESYNAYVDLLHNNNLANMTEFIEQKFPELQDTEKLKQEATTDWFWEQSGELTRLAEVFDFAYIYYVEKTENGYIFLIASDIGPDKNPEWLGGPVWSGPTPAFIDEAWETGELTFSSTPTVNEWGSLTSVALPILSDGKVVGVLGVDYEVSQLGESLRESEDNLALKGDGLLNQMAIVLVICLIVILAVMIIQILLNRNMVVIPNEVREANERVNAMLDSAPLLISFWDENGVMLDCNLEALKTLGLSKKSDYIEHFYDLNPEYQPDGRSTKEKSAELIGKAFATGYQRFEWEYRTASGEPLPVETTLVRVSRGDENMLAAYSRDLREIKETEAAAKLSAERVRLMLDTMTPACCLYNNSGDISECNNRMLKLFGCRDLQQLNEIGLTHLTPEYQSDGTLSTEKMATETQKAMADGENTFFFDHIHFDGSPLPVEITLRKVDWNSETPTLIAYMSDLRELYKTEDSLARIMSITDGSPNLTLHVSDGGVIDYVNSAIFDITGYTEKELKENGLRLLLEPDDLNRIRQEYYSGKPQNRSVKIELPVNCKNGERRDFIFQIFATHLHSGKTGAGILGQDITDLKQLQQNLIIAVEQAKQALAHEEQLNKMKSDFLSRISHELRTPLNAIIGMTAIAEKSSGSDEQKHCFEIIKGSSDELLGMVSDILDMTDFDAGRIDFTPLPFSFAAAMSTVIDTVTQRAKAKGLVFTADIDGNIHDSVVGDERRLTQVLTKLLGNAVKFTPKEGAIRLSARLLESQEQECVVRFEVSDNGIGIDKETQQRLWGTFEQADNSITREFGGMGIGLPLVKRIIDLMGGEIRVESEPSKGSRFICDIRFDMDSSAPELQEVDLTGRRILIVDDVEVNREILTALLEGTGAILDEALDGEEAVRMFSQSKYDLILMDLHMPVMDGFSATKEIRDSAQPWAKTVPVISVSAESGMGAHGITDHIQKPVDMDTLFATIRKWL